MKYMAIAMICLVLAGCGTLNMRHSHTPTPKGMVLIPAGSNSGTNLGVRESFDHSYEPTYSLTVRAFYMDRMEVTKAQWDEVRSWGLTHGYTDLSVGGGKAVNHPVQTVTWYDVVKWCNARSEREGRTPAYYTTSSKSTIYKTGQINIENTFVNWSSGYRLPTEVEWEYAARGGVASHRFPWRDSDDIQHVRANYYSWTNCTYDTSPTREFHPTDTNGVEPYTCPVGSFAPNGYGLYDMAGNVWEWCWDGYPGYVGSNRMGRGGSWFYPADDCRVANHYFRRAFDAHYFIGFRVVLSLDQ